MNHTFKSTRQHYRASAFTLTELLVVILIIASLFALGFVGVSKLRQAGDQVVSARNLSQLQVANAGYAGDNNGQYVPIYEFNDTGSGYVAWCDSPKFISYLKGDTAVYQASDKGDVSLPLNMLDASTVKAKQRGFNNVQASFGYITSGIPVKGGGWGNPNGSVAFMVHQLTAPARTAVFVTATDWNVQYSSRFLWQGAGAVEGKTVNQKMAYRHKDKALVVYYDGHMAALSKEDIKKIDTQGGPSNIFWDGDAR